MNNKLLILLAIFSISRMLLGCGDDGGFPDTIINAAPFDITNHNEATFIFGTSGGGQTFDCRLDGGDWEPCETPVSYSDLSDGSHVFEVRAVSGKGEMDPEPAVFTWVVDTVPPETDIESYPSSPTTSTTAEFTFFSSEADSTYECELDSGEWRPCTSPAVFAGLYHGDHTLRVRSVDVAGNPDASPETFTWEVITWVSVSAGYAHVCEIRFDGLLRCWGNNQGGQLGDGTTDSAAVPVSVGSDTDWEYVSSGTAHTCSQKGDRMLWCWGSNEYGQLGDGSGQDRVTPARVAGDQEWISVSAGGWHTCGVGADRSLWCWGNNDMGQLGDGTIDAKAAPVRIGSSTNWISTDVGYFHSCGRMTDGTLYCWGYNFYGQLGDGSCGT